jgi:hypothetical protein
MSTVLLTAGVVSVLAAVVGGGLKAFDVEMPVLKSSGTRAALGVVGIVFLVTAVLLRENNDGEDPAEARYQRQVMATCNAVGRVSAKDVYGQSLGFDQDTNDRTYDRDVILSRSRAKLEAVKQRFDLLFAGPIPNALRPDADIARRRVASSVRRNRKVLRELESALRPITTEREIDAATAPYQSQLDAAAARLEDAMNKLAGRECRLSSIT